MRDFAEDNPHVERHAAALLQRAWARHRHADQQGARSCPRCRRSSASTHACSSCTRTTSCGRSCSSCDNQLPGIYNVAGDGLLPWSEVAAICGKRTMPLPPIGTGSRRAPLERLGVELPARAARRCCGTAAASTTGGSSGPASRYHYTSAGAVEDFVEALRLRSTVGDSRPAYRYERDVEKFFRHSPAVVRDLRLSPRLRGRRWPTRVASVTLDDPERRNALIARAGRRDRRRLRRSGRRPAVGAVVVTGAPPAFCAGADLSHLAGAGRRKR